MPIAFDPRLARHQLHTRVLCMLVGPWALLACSKAEEGTVAAAAPPLASASTTPASSGEISAPVSSGSPAADPAMPQPRGATAELPKAAADGLLTVHLDGRSVPAARARSVVHLGDSMVPLVGNYLRPRIEGQGGRYDIVSTSSSSTLSWAAGTLLRDTLAKHDPELVLISLGSNELYFVDDLAERAEAIRAIVREVGNRACLWIGPPSWAKARGFLDTLEANLGHCSYFDSAKLPMERQADGRHPTWGASHAWANKVWQRLGGDATGKAAGDAVQ